MFSTIGNIISGQQKPREAEQSNTRLDIQRHDPDQERRQHDKESEDELNTFLSEDQASVSIDSLYVFLETFLHGQMEKASAAENQNRANIEIPETDPQRDAKPNVQNQAARAAGAYAHAAEVSDIKSTLREAQSAEQSMDIDSEEVRMIHALLADLNTLAAKGVQSLHIEREETFLLSLRSAVDKVKSNLT